jgi:hypothetical protein
MYAFEWWDEGILVRESNFIPESELDAKRQLGACAWLTRPTRAIIINCNGRQVQNLLPGEAVLTLEQEYRLAEAVECVMCHYPLNSEMSIIKRALTGTSDDIASWWVRDTLSNYLQLSSIR